MPEQEEEVIYTTCPNCQEQYNVKHTGCSTGCAASRPALK